MTVASLVLIAVAVGLLGFGLLDGSNTYLVGSILMSLLAALTLVVGSRRGEGRAAVAAAVEAESEQARGRSRARAERRARRMAQDRQDRYAEDGPGDDRYPDGRYHPDERDGEYGADLDYEDELVGAGVRRRGEPAERSGRSLDDGYRDREGPVRTTYETDVIDLDRTGVHGRPMVAEPASDQRPPARERFHEQAAGYADDAEDDDFDGDFDDDPPDEPPIQPTPPAEAARVARLNSEVLVIDGRPRYHLAGCVHLLGRDSEPLPVSEAAELGFTPCSLCEPDSALLARARRV